MAGGTPGTSLIPEASTREKSVEPGQTPLVDPVLRRASLAACACFLLALIAYSLVDIDLWHQMALIQASLSAGHLLRTDPFAYTPTIAPWIDHEWGAGAIAYFSTLWFGGKAILVLKFLLAFATGWLCVWCSKENGTDPRLFTLCAPLAIYLAHLGFFAALRAQAYTFFFTALLILCWEMDRKGRRGWTIVWLALFPLWVNLHGGFVVGIGLMALHCAEEWLRGRDVRRMLAVLGGMLLETLLTPYGRSYFAYLQRALLMARPYVPEWQPLWHLGPVWIGCFVVAAGLAGYAVATVSIRSTPGLAPLVATALEAILHRKLLPLFAIVWLCYTPLFLQRTPGGEWVLRFMQRRRAFVLGAWATLALVSVLVAIRHRPWNLDVAQPIYPVGPVEYLAEQKFSGNLMVPFRAGAYVSWKLYPAVRVSLDGRYEEVYPDSTMRAIFDFYEGRPGWRATLEAYPTDLVLVPLGSPISPVIVESQWQRVYRDRHFELYGRPGLPLVYQDWTSRSLTGIFP